MDNVQYSGGFADVLRCECGGREVAIKALRPQYFSLQEMRQASEHLRGSLAVSIGKLNVHLVEVLQGSYHLEISQTSECVRASRGGHD